MILLLMDNYLFDWMGFFIYKYFGYFYWISVIKIFRLELVGYYMRQIYDKWGFIDFF